MQDMIETYRVVKIGAIAAETLQECDSGQVLGITSSGAFLKCDQRIVFLTSMDYNSPFNLLIENCASLITILTPGDQFEISDHKILFAGKNVSIQFKKALVWTPSPPTLLISSQSQQKKRLEEIANQLSILKPDQGFLYLIREMEKGEEAKDDRVIAAARGVLASFEAEDMGRFLEHAVKLVGLGGGLTPSGDDLLAGFFLYQTRLDMTSNQQRFFIQESCKELTAIAREKTTTISANRIEAAGRGWAEEIFLQLLDHLFDPSINLIDHFNEHVVNFGHSSGVDTIVGIYLAIKTAK